jgi:hypothetical protein
VEEETMNTIMAHAQVIAMLSQAVKTLTEAGVSTTKVMGQLETFCDDLDEIRKEAKAEAAP